MPPKGRNRRDGTISIDPNYPRPQRTDHSIGAGQITGKNPRRQTVIGVIGQMDRLFFCVKTDDCEDGAKEFLRYCRCIRRIRTIQDRWGKIKSRTIKGRPPP
jgi:hypothetical protein